MDKVFIRKEMIKRREEISLAQKSHMDREILKRLLESKYYNNSNVIFTFVSFKKEVDTHNLIGQALKDGKKICVPRVINKKSGMVACYIDGLHSLTPGCMGILEPGENAVLANKDDMDLIIVPGLAFDRKGGRIGYGGGYYDKFLEELPGDIPKVAIAYDFQIIHYIRMCQHDIKVDLIITDKGIYYC